MLSITCLDENGNLITNLTQWDKNQVLIIKGINLTDVPEIHFCNKNSEEAFVVMPTMGEDGTISVKIPNCFLQEALPLYVYLYVYSTEVSGKTIETIKIPVRKRTKPSDYVYEENVSIVSTVPILIEMLDTPPLPSAGARGLFPKEDGWYDYDENGNAIKLATSAELKEISANSELVVEETANSDVAKSYVLKQGETVIASIDIPLDMVVSSGAVETYTDDNLPDAIDVAGTYIVLTIANSTSDKLYININDLVEINEIADDLITDDSNKVLSAKQGKILNDTKVDKVEGKGLSSNDFTDEHIEKITTLENNKVDKVDGKSLSTNDFTDELKTKLENIDENANNYTHPETHSADMIEGLAEVATSGSFNDLVDTPEIPIVDTELIEESSNAISNGAVSNAIASIEEKKADKTDILNDTTTTDVVIESLESNAEKVYGELTSISVAFPTDVGLDYMSSIVFSTPAELTENYSTFPSEVYFKGDESDGGIFIPNPSTRYTILFYYDGVKLIGLVCGIEIEVVASE